VFDIKTRVSSLRKFTLATTLCTWSPDELAHLLSVITHSFDFIIILFQKYKKLFTFLHTQPKPENTFTALS
jgi:hypothetical protein